MEFAALTSCVCGYAAECVCVGRRGMLSLSLMTSDRCSARGRPNICVCVYVHECACHRPPTVSTKRAPVFVCVCLCADMPTRNCGMRGSWGTAHKSTGVNELSDGVSFFLYVSTQKFLLK